jgi:uncharacterized SAM-binding protein YcdF (DUF218 family)
MFAGWAISAAAVVLWSSRDERHPASAIVVLGAAQYVGKPSPVLRARLDHAIELFKNGLAPKLIFTGGRGVGDTTSEAAVGRRYAMRQGVPDEAILLESRGHTTSESLQATAALMRARGMRSVILVSDGFHMLRLRILARRFGLEPYTSPTPSSPITANPTAAVRYTLSESVKAPLAYLMERDIAEPKPVKAP